MGQPAIEDLLRREAPQVLAALVRRYGNFEASEDAVQEALLAASVRWPVDGVPRRPRAWLTTVASRRLTDELRSSGARRRREDLAAGRERADTRRVAGPEDVRPAVDDTLGLLLLCCHPSLSPTSQMALTLRAVGGLTTAEIARAFLVPEATMAQRISRAKAQLRERGARFGPAAEAEREARLDVVLHVLYLVFNEGYTATSGRSLQRRELATEAIRLTRLLRTSVPDDAETAGLLALMLLTEARHAARATADGELVTLAEQDRSLWDRGLVEEGVAILSDALGRGRVGPYQLQAAIAAVHDEAPSYDDTDWVEVLGLYRVLERVAPSPVVALNRAVALAMVAGPDAGLAALAPLEDDPGLARGHRLHAVRAHLLETRGDTAEAAATYREAARRTASLPERRYLLERAARLGPATGPVPDVEPDVDPDVDRG